jgi:hypothetical protein
MAVNVRDSAIPSGSYTRIMPTSACDHPCRPRALHGEHQWSVTANHGQSNPLLKGSAQIESCCSQARNQQQVPPAGLGSGMAAGLDLKVVSHQLHGYPVASAAEGSRPGAGVHVVQPPGAPHGPLPPVCSKASPPTRRDTRFAPRILRQAGASHAAGDLGPCSSRARSHGDSRGTTAMAGRISLTARENKSQFAECYGPDLCKAGLCHGAPCYLRAARGGSHLGLRPDSTPLRR